MGYYSQSGQDRYTAEVLLPSIKSGFYVDIGANDGITFNNSLFFENLCWTGLAIEPHPGIYKKLISNRKCQCINTGIADKPGSMKFRAIEGPVNMLSGFVDQYDQNHIKRISDEIKLHGGKFEDIQVPCDSLANILEARNINYVDFLSIDVEVYEFNILKSINFKKFHISVIAVENNYKDYKIPHLLHNSGFRIDAMMGDDNIFINSTLL